jgi:hypothetical protein
MQSIRERGRARSIRSVAVEEAPMKTFRSSPRLAVLAAVALASSAQRTVLAQGLFGGGTDYPVGATPVGVAIGDFDRDGKLDLAVGNLGEASVSILLGDGNGGFSPATSIPTSQIVKQIEVADMNADGSPDIVLLTGLTVSVLLGDGAGGFGSPIYYSGGPYSGAVGVGDLDGDGYPDVALTWSNTIDVFLALLHGDGQGGLALMHTYNLTFPPWGVAMADFNGDGRLDVVVANGSDYSVSVLLGDGHGSLAFPLSFDAGTNPFRMAIGDLDGDANLDLAVLDQPTNSVAVLHGHGDGVFSSPAYYSVHSNARSIALGDFDGDGRPDLAVACSTGVDVLLANGSGGFDSAVSFGNASGWVAAGDLNRDGKPDLASVQINSNNVSVLLDQSAATFFSFCYGSDVAAEACPCGNAGGSGRGCQNSAASGGAQLSASGMTSPDSVVLAASGELPSVLSIFLQGDAAIVPVTFGDGLRCAGGHLKRLYAKNASAGSTSAPSAGDPSITSRSAALGDPIAPGSSRFYQVYYRDPVLTFCPSPSGNAWNVGNAVAIAW